MATLTAQSIAYTGTAVTLAAADAEGDRVAYNRNTFLWVKNGDTDPHTVTVSSEAPISPGLVQADVAVAIPAGEERLIGPFSQTGFRNSDGFVTWEYDAVTDVTIAAVSIPAV